jgi:hypothetical protein
VIVGLQGDRQAGEIPPACRVVVLGPAGSSLRPPAGVAEGAAVRKLDKVAPVAAALAPDVARDVSGLTLLADERVNGVVSSRVLLEVSASIEFVVELAALGESLEGALRILPLLDRTSLTALLLLPDRDLERALLAFNSLMAGQAVYRGPSGRAKARHRRGFYLTALALDQARHAADDRP